MHNILFEYEMPPTTWVYVSALMTVGIYFKFHRVLSVRNLDLFGLIAFSPGLLLVSRGQGQLGYVWLFTVTGFFLVRVLLDQLMVRRPLLEPNLSASGLTFACGALMAFMIGTIVTAPAGQLDPDALKAAQPAGAPADRNAAAVKDAKPEPPSNTQPGAGYPPFYRLAEAIDARLAPAEEGGDLVQRRLALVRRAIAGSMAILGHLAVVIGMILIGYRHFDNMHTGMAAATLYLLSPYTAQMTSEVVHVVPAALLVWAVMSYRQPVAAGVMVGLAAAAVFFPLFLLPLWLGFYWRRGLVRFAIGFACTLAVLVGLLFFVPGTFSENLKLMFVLPSRLSGFWEYHVAAFRIPVIAAFVALCGSFALWPAQKNLGTLLSCSAAVMLGAQFWHPVDGGIYMAWYLPLLILTIFRPNLEDRVALATVTEGPRLFLRG
jgi:hypothetical protein